MNRAEAAAEVADRFGKYLSAADRTTADVAITGIKGPLDTALRALGYSAAEMATANPTGDAEEDFRVQLAYRIMLQVNLDLGPTMMNINTGGDSYALQAFRAAAEKDLLLTQQAVLNRFGTLGVVLTADTSESDAGVFITLRESLLLEVLPDWIA